MRRNLVFAVLAVTACLWDSGAARAQPACETTFETIVTLHPPRLGIPTVWDAVYGRKDEMVQFASGVPEQDGTVTALGRTMAAEDFRPLKTVLAELNRRGRVLTEKTYPLRDGEVPVKMIAVENGYIAASNMRGGPKKNRGHVRIAWYGNDADYRRAITLDDDVYDYEVLDLVPAADSAGFVVIVHAVGHADETDQHGLLARFSSDGREMWKRAYRPGIPNRIAGLAPLDDGGYLSAGRIRLDDGRMAGWVMNLGPDGTVLWQRTYPRGKFSVLRRAAAASAMTGHEGRRYFLLGDSTPLDDGPDAAWILAIDALGEPLWQRYFRRPDYALSGFGLMRSTDGRLVVAMNAQAQEGSGLRDHIRMLTLSPRGVIIEDESYVEGIEARGTDFIRGGNGERIVTATIESDDTPADDDTAGDTIFGKTDETAPGPEKKKHVTEGWIFVATALDPYADHCDIKRGN